MKLFPPMYIFNLYNMITYNRVTFNTIIPLIPKHFKKTQPIHQTKRQYMRPSDLLSYMVMQFLMPGYQ